MAKKDDRMEVYSEASVDQVRPSESISLRSV